MTNLRDDFLNRLRKLAAPFAGLPSTDVNAFHGVDSKTRTQPSFHKKLSLVCTNLTCTTAALACCITFIKCSRLLNMHAPYSGIIPRRLTRELRHFPLSYEHGRIKRGGAGWSRPKLSVVLRVVPPQFDYPYVDRSSSDLTTPGGRPPHRGDVPLEGYSKRGNPSPPSGGGADLEPKIDSKIGRFWPSELPKKATFLSIPPPL